MPKIPKLLTVAALSKLRMPGRYAVGGCAGLHLRIRDSGARAWVLRVLVQGVRRDVTLGCPDVMSLAQAREAGTALRRALAAGCALGEALVGLRPAPLPVAHPFADCAHALIAAKQSEWRNAKHRAQWLATLQTYAFPVLGEMDVANIEVAHVLQVLQPIWTAKIETASRLRGRIEAVLDFASAQGWRSDANPARWKGLLDKLLPAPQKLAKVVHHRALSFEAARDFMAALAAVQGTSALALRLLMLTACRAGEVRAACWDEFDMQAAVWTIPAQRMKAGRAHRVPLPSQALALLRAVPRLHDVWLFPAPRGNGPISDMAMTQLMRRMNIDAVPHGFRSTFRDWAGDCTHHPREVMEAALAHTLGNQVEAAYRRSDALQKRRVLMQDWADFLVG